MGIEVAPTRNITGGSRIRSRLLLLLLVALLGAIAATAPPSARADAPPIRHVWTITLENALICQNPTNEADPRKETGCPLKSLADIGPYLGQVLPAEGTLVDNYFGIGHESMDNYIAEVSGQAPNPSTQIDCLDDGGDVTPGTMDLQGQVVGKGCTYPLGVHTIADQLDERGLSWKGYMEDMGRDSAQDGTGCSVSNANGGNDDYVAKHNPFVWFHSILDNPANPPGYCAAHVVALDEMREDLRRIDTTPNFSFITPNMSDDGHDWKFPTMSAWAAYWVRKIMASPAYRQDGMIAIVWDENGDSNFFSVPGSTQVTTSCCGEIPGPGSPFSGGASGQGGGQTGAWIITPYGTPGTVADTDPVTTPGFKAYNHYSLLRSLEDIFGITTGGSDGQGHLGYAAGNGGPNDAVGFRSLGCDDIFTITCPPMAGAVPSPKEPAHGTGVGPRAADGTARWLNPAPQGNDLNAVSCAGAQQCVAVGSAGAAVSTQAGGGWTPRRTGTATALNGVSCPSQTQLCVAVGAGGTILRSTDGGDKWSTVDSGTAHDLSGVSCPSSSACFAVGTAGVVLASGDGGATWSSQASHTTRDLFAISCPSLQTCYATGGAEATTGLNKVTTYKGDLLVTRDGGTTWSTVAPSASTGSYRAVACSDEQHCVLGAEGRSFPYTTSDGGSSTSPGPFDIGGRLEAASCGGPGLSCVLVGGFGSVLRVVDGKQVNDSDPATPQPLPSGVDFLGVSCPTASVCYAVGRNGAIFASSDGGKTWDRSGADRASSNARTRVGHSGGDSTPIGSLDLAGASCATPQACVVVGWLGAIITSGDAGASWAARGGLRAPGADAFHQPVMKPDPANNTCCDSGHSVASPIPECETQTTDPLLAKSTCDSDTLGRYFPLNAVSCARPSACVAVGELGKVATTADLEQGGGTWSVSSVRSQAGLSKVTTLSGVSCPSGSHACTAVGDYGAILRSTDDGVNWSAQDSPTKAFLNSVSCADVSHCVAVGAQGTVLASSDGSSWHAGDAGKSAYLSAVSCPTVSSCLAVGSGGTVLGSDDGGQTWSSRSAPSDDDLYGVSCFSASACVTTGSAGTVATTADGGDTWNLQGTGTTDTLRSISCATPAHCFAAGENGAVMDITPQPPFRRSGGPVTATPKPAGFGGLGKLFTGATCAGRAIRSQILSRGLPLSHGLVQVSGRSRTLRCRQDRVTRVRVAIGRMLRRGRCQFLAANGRLGRSRLCSRPVYQLARVHYVPSGQVTDWTFRRRAVLPPGRYVVQARGQNREGQLEARAISRRTSVLARRR